MDNQSQLLKGILEGCILLVISQKEVYGYELSERLHQAGLTMVKEGSIYPVLARMQKLKWIKGTMKPSPSGPNRKYYKLTSEGKEALKQFEENWDDIIGAVSQLKGEM
ncbi:PadR family transcriptional regulator [Priestia endophytica]|uniref:PadR family transcriptional regulator n=1 Tax=Priestia endophytica TaxID=135735 RepID=UPI003D285DA0